jgi:hypothetical protein
MMKRNRSGQTGALRTEARTGATLCLDLRHKYDSYINMQRRWTLAASLLQVSGKSLSCQHSAGEN